MCINNNTISTCPWNGVILSYMPGDSFILSLSTGLEGRSQKYPSYESYAGKSVLVLSEAVPWFGGEWHNYLTDRLLLWFAVCCNDCQTSCLPWQLRLVRVYPSGRSRLSVMLFCQSKAGQCPSSHCPSGGLAPWRSAELMLPKRAS